jgi:hypothetical protein
MTTCTHTDNWLVSLLWHFIESGGAAATLSPLRELVRDHGAFEHAAPQLHDALHGFLAENNSDCPTIKPERRTTMTAEPKATTQDVAMNTYVVLFAEDIPHYGLHEIEAPNDEDALKAALQLHKTTDHLLDDANWDGGVCSRIVYLRRPDASEVICDHPLDSYTLLDKDEVRQLLAASKPMLAALEACALREDIMDSDLGPVITAAIASARGQQ